MFQRQPWMQRAGEFPSGDLEYHELLARAVFSGGLGPRVVEARWAGIKEAFAGFEPSGVAALGTDDVNRMLVDPGVIRNRRKIEAVIENAGRFLEVSAEHGGFHEFLLAAGGESDLESVAARLAEGFRHLGPTSASLFLFSAGWRAESGAETASGVGGEDVAAVASGGAAHAPDAPDADSKKEGLGAGAGSRKSPPSSTKTARAARADKAAAA